MKLYTFNYSIKDRISFRPLFHVEEAAEDRTFAAPGRDITFHSFVVQFVRPTP